MINNARVYKYIYIYIKTQNLLYLNFVIYIVI